MILNLCESYVGVALGDSCDTSIANLLAINVLLLRVPSQKPRCRASISTRSPAQSALPGEEGNTPKPPGRLLCLGLRKWCGLGAFAVAVGVSSVLRIFGSGPSFERCRGNRIDDRCRKKTRLVPRATSATITRRAGCCVAQLGGPCEKEQNPDRDKAKHQRAHHPQLHVLEPVPTIEALQHWRHPPECVLCRGLLIP